MNAPRPSSPLRWPVRAFALLWFLLCFVKELVLSNFAVARTVLLQKRADLTPGFLTYDLRGLTAFEIVVLTHCITLTPGTASVEISDDETTAVLHALDARDPAAIRDSIKTRLEAPLLRWTR